MAFATRWRVERKNPQTGENWKASIQEDGFLGVLSDLKPDQVTFRISYRPIGLLKDTPHWTIASSVLEVYFIDDGTGLLADLWSADDEDFKVILNDGTDGEWFVQPDSYEYVAGITAPASITGSDRVGDLAQTPYLQNDGTPYSGDARLIEIVANCLLKTGLSMDMRTHMRWYPFLDSNGLTENEDPLYHLWYDQANFYDDDGNPYSCLYVLEQIMGRFQMQLFQVFGGWYMQQRQKAESGANYQVFNYSPQGAPNPSPTTDIRTRVALSIPTGVAFKGYPVYAAQPPLKRASSLYLHGSQFDGLNNLSFEDSIRAPITGTPLVDGINQTGTNLNIDGVTSSVIPANMYFTIAGDPTIYQTRELATATAGSATLPIHPPIETAPADNAAITFDEDIGAWEISHPIASGVVGQSNVRPYEGAQSLFIETVYQTSGASPLDSYLAYFARQKSITEIGGGSGVKHDIRFWLRPDDISLSNSEVTFFWEYQVGAYWYDANNGVWTTTQTLSSIPLKTQDHNGAYWREHHFTTPVLDDTGMPIDGEIILTFHGAVESNDAGGATQDKVYIDLITLRELTEDGEESSIATLTTVQYSASRNRQRSEEVQFIIGDGPGSGHRTRLRLEDTTGTFHEVTSDWSTDPADVASEVSLAKHWGNEMLKERWAPQRTIRATLIDTSGAAPLPNELIRIENSHNTDQPDYTWMRLDFTPAEKEVFHGLFAEILKGENADEACSLGFEPGSVQARALREIPGDACTELEPAFFPGSAFTHVYALTRGGLANGAVVKFERDDENLGLGTWTETVLIAFGAAGTDVQFMRVDEAAGFIFTAVLTSAAFDLYRHELDGSNGTIIYSSSLTEEITGMDIDRAGQFIWLTRASTAEGYLTRVDYAGNASTLYTFTKAAGGTFNGPMWDRLDKCYFFGDDGSLGSNLFLYYYNAVTNNVALVSGPWDASFGLDRKYGVGSAARGFLLFNPLTGANSNSIAKIPLPAAGSISYPVIPPNAAERGCAVDWNSLNFFYAPGAGQVQRKNIDGTGDTHVATASSGDDIYDLCVGF